MKAKVNYNAYDTWLEPYIGSFKINDMKKKDLKIGTRVHFHSGNFAGLDGHIETLDWNSNHPDAIFGFLHKVKFSNGNYGFIEKSDHFKIVK